MSRIAIPNSTGEIDDGAFSGCTNLIEISVSKDNPVYHSTDNCLIETNSKALIKGCNTSIIPIDGSVNSIGRYAFAGCTVLTKITIPNSVINIDNGAFANCKNLKEVTLPEGIRSVNMDAFFGCTSLTSIEIPSSIKCIEWGAFSGCSSLSSIIVISNNKYYHSDENCLIDTKRKVLIAGCNGSSVPADGSVTEIADGAFSGCLGLKSVVIPACISYIGNSAFEGCTHLTNMSISKDLKRIGQKAFYGCTGLKGTGFPYEKMIEDDYYYIDEDADML